VVKLIGLLGIVSAVALAQQAPALPDFAGSWVLDASRGTITGAPRPAGGGRGMITEPRKIKDVRPQYPPEAQRARIGGYVILEAIIDSRGKVDDIRVIRSVPELERAAVDAVSQWEYTPTFVDGVAIPVIMTVTVTFSIQGSPMRQAVPPPNQIGPGMGAGRGRGRFGTHPAPVMTIEQNQRSLTMHRQFGDRTERITYDLAGREVRNRIPGAGGARDDTYRFTSRWDGDRLVTHVAWNGPAGRRERLETMWLEGDSLFVQHKRLPVAAEEPPHLVTDVFVRRK
jgi:TonB family protein